MLRPILLSLAILGFAPVAHAENIYEIKNVSVTVQEPDALKAREKAFTEAQTKAFDQLQKKLTESGQTLSGAKPTPTQVQNSVKSIDIVNEKITPNQYRASYNIIFNEARISKLFNIAEIKPVKEADKFLVVPIVLDKMSAKIWKNDWRKTWENAKNDSIIFPLGDLQDIQSLKNEDIAANKYDGIIKMQKRYAATSVVLIQAEYVEQSQSLQVQLEKIKDNNRTVINYEYPGGNGITQQDLFDAAANDLAFRLQNDKLTDESAYAGAPAEQLAPTAPAAQTPAAAPIPANKTPEPYSPFAPGTGVLGAARPQASTPAATMQNMPPAAGHSQLTPSAEVPAPATNSQFDAVVTAPDLIVWNRIRNKLVVSKGIDDLQIKSFSAGQAYVSIKHSADIETLRQTLDSKGLVLIGQGNNWEIKEK